jgi:hypothetical protein
MCTFKSVDITLAEDEDEDQQDFDLPFFSFSTLISATNDFSNYNKLGEGGFGPVYKVINMQQLKYNTHDEQIKKKILESHLLTIFPTIRVH